jgi:hypothetical protein
MTRDPWDGEERRLYERHAIRFQVEVEMVEPGAPMRQLKGASVKISRGGALLRVDGQARTGARCRVSFKKTGGRISPSRVTGRIRRLTSGESGRGNIVVQFDRPLDQVKAPGEI